MQASSIPRKFNIPFANNAGPTYTNVIPQASQIGITGGAASLVDGFPPITFVPITAGGIPPWGKDFNGLLNQITAWTQFNSCAGGLPTYDSTFSGLIGGYPYGTFLAAAFGVTAGSPQGGNHGWFSTVDNNTINPDVTFNSANWVPVPAVINTPVTYTIGAGGQFTDLNAAYNYLSRFTIMHAGTVVLQYAAGVYNYVSTMVYIDHPQNHRISILGAPMISPIDTTNSSYTGSIASSMSYLRSHFATELHFTGGSGIEVNTVQPAAIDGLLVTGDGTFGISDGQGIAFSCNGFSSEVSYGPSRLNGLAICQFNFGFTMISGGSLTFPFSSPVVLIGNTIYGMIGNARSYGFFNGNIISYNNGLNDIICTHESCFQFNGTVYAGNVLCQNESFVNIVHSYSASLSPAVGVVGNGNALIIQGTGN